jgi:hypothetical protein
VSWEDNWARRPSRNAILPVLAFLASRTANQSIPVHIINYSRPRYQWACGCKKTAIEEKPWMHRMYRTQC